MSILNDLICYTGFVFLVLEILLLSSLRWNYVKKWFLAFMKQEDKKENYVFYVVSEGKNILNSESL